MRQRIGYRHPGNVTNPRNFFPPSILQVPSPLSLSFSIQVIVPAPHRRFIIVPRVHQIIDSPRDLGVVVSFERKGGGCGGTFRFTYSFDGIYLEVRSWRIESLLRDDPSFTTPGTRIVEEARSFVPPLPVEREARVDSFWQTGAGVK